LAVAESYAKFLLSTTYAVCVGFAGQFINFMISSKLQKWPEIPASSIAEKFDHRVDCAAGQSVTWNGLNFPPQGTR
jgi:hypothetical protein